MVRSKAPNLHSEKDKTNQRLIDLTRIHYAHREGIRIGFNGFDQSDENDDIEAKDQEGDQSARPLILLKSPVKD